MMVASKPAPSMVCQKSLRHIDGHVLVYADDLKRMFHLPIADAAGKIGLCQTTFKKTCRRLGIEHWPYKKGAKRRNAYKDTPQEDDSAVARLHTQIATPLPSLHRQSLCAPASMMSTPWTAQEQDSAMNNAWRRTESVPSFFSSEQSSPPEEPSCELAAPGDLRGMERGAGGECIEAVLDYLDACEVGGHSGFLILLEDELVRDGHFARP
ncbi:hypothetical protein T484DRAFT_1976637 [Baffinella frigidus]|nr:hypothetical protein T484DRAFT_1976637 [Cryptophyta sp. CCMP2293]